MYDGKRNPLFDMVKQSTNAVFSQNPLIQQLSNDKAWTISDKNKAPLDVPFMIQTNFQEVRPAKLSDPERPYPLVSLNQINNIPELSATNRAYRLSAIENRTFVLDIEPKTNDNILLQWANFPAQYTEVSKNGGLHLLIQVPESLITPENEYIFDTVPVIKDITDDQTIEYIFNKHYITFTKKIPLEKKPAKFKENSTEYIQLKQLLDHLVTLDENNKKARLYNSNIHSEYNEDELHMDLINKQLAEEQGFIYKALIKNENFIQSLPTLEESNNDNSKRDYKTALRLIYALMNNIGYIAQQGNGTMIYYNKTDHIKDLTEKDYIYIIYKYLEYVLEYRDKHDEYRDGMPWLLFTAHKAYHYIKSQHISATKKTKEYDNHAAFYSLASH